MTLGDCTGLSNQKTLIFRSQLKFLLNKAIILIININV
jgi:hypothetical protein